MFEPLRILLVDDDEDDLSFMGDALVSCQPDICLVKKQSGQVALDYLNGVPSAQRPDGILIDEKMPGMPGHELIIKLSEILMLRDVPKFLITGVPTSESLSKYEAFGLVRSYLKPASLAGLREIACDVIARCSR